MIFCDIIPCVQKIGGINMKNAVTNLKYADISNDCFVITPSQIDAITEMFSNTLAETMNIRPLAGKIRQIATESIIKTLKTAKTMGE
jgi:methyltransferase-like protein